MKASRQFQIIRYAQKGLDIEEIDLNDEEKKFYDSIVRDLKRWRAKGIEPMYDLPYDYCDDEEGSDEPTDSIYSDDFNDRVIAKLNNK